jgi:hypothetical protein
MERAWGNGWGRKYPTHGCGEGLSKLYGQKEEGIGEWGHKDGRE